MAVQGDDRAEVRGDDRAEAPEAGTVGPEVGTAVCVFSDDEEVSAAAFCKTTCWGKSGRRNRILHFLPAWIFTSLFYHMPDTDKTVFFYKTKYASLQSKLPFQSSAHRHRKKTESQNKKIAYPIKPDMLSLSKKVAERRLFWFKQVKKYSKIEVVMKMIIKHEDGRREVAVLDLEALIPKNHLLRKIDRSVDWNKIYEFVENLYSPNMGRPSVDPVVLVKMVLLLHLYGLRSLRQTADEVSVNLAFRWFIGYGFYEKTPHFSTLSYNFKHRFSSEVFEKIFNWVLEEAISGGYVKPEVIFVDSTHIKANANRKKQMKKYVPAAVKTYEEQLHKEINEDREEHGKPPFDDNDTKGGTDVETREVAVSTTDPESGLFHKGDHQKCFAYSAHTACDRNNFILGVEVTPGNIHDSLEFDAVYEQVTKQFPEVEVVTADAGYKTPWICKKIFDDGRIPSMPYKRPMTKKGNHPWYEYVYDEYYDCVLCPENHVLNYATTDRDGYREFKSKPYICKDCPTRFKCTNSRNCQKTVTRHIWQEYIERAEDIRHSPLGKATYELRSQTIERVFADAKEKYGMRYTTFKGLAQVTNWVRLKFAAMNLKKLALWGHISPQFTCFFAIFSTFYRKPAISLA